MHDYETLRMRMVERQIHARGVRDPHVLRAMETVPRHLFVPEDQRSYAYDDTPLPIGFGQTISQPYIVALMTELLKIKPNDIVLEIGSGSGYQAAVLAQLADRVITVERIPELANQARENIERAGLVNVAVHVDDGTLGFTKEAPYDAIIVTAAGPDVPEPLTEQLSEGGRLIIPVGGTMMQELILVEQRGGQLLRSRHGGCRFVKLIGAQGWRD